MKPGLTPTAAASVLLGLAAWFLASWGENAAFNVFPLQAIAAVLAVVLAIWAWRIPVTAGSGRVLGRWLAGGGLGRANLPAARRSGKIGRNPLGAGQIGHHYVDMPKRQLPHRGVDDHEEKTGWRGGPGHGRKQRHR